MMNEIYTYITHDFIRGQTTVEYLTDSETGDPFIITEVNPLRFDVELATGEEISRFWLKHRAVMNNKTEFARMLFLDKARN